MEDIAALAGITRRTLYNNYADKEALFTQIVTDVIAHAAEFAHGLRADLAAPGNAAEVRTSLRDLGRRLALGIVRPEVIAIRRLLIGEARVFPSLAREYFDRAPRQVIEALSSRFGELTRVGLLRAAGTRRAAEQFAYLVAGEPLDYAVLVGTAPSRDHLIACAREGVETFLARYGIEQRTERRGSVRKRRRAT